MTRSRLFPHPALWPMLCLSPEPFGTAADGDSIERLYQEWFGPGSQTVEQVANQPEPNPRAIEARRLNYRPSSRLHQFPRRR